MAIWGNTWVFNVRLSDRFKVTQNKTNFVKFLTKFILFCVTLNLSEHRNYILLTLTDSGESIFLLVLFPNAVDLCKNINMSSILSQEHKTSFLKKWRTNTLLTLSRSSLEKSTGRATDERSVLSCSSSSTVNSALTSALNFSCTFPSASKLYIAASKGGLLHWWQLSRSITSNRHFSCNSQH